MTLEERIELERKENDSLALEIERRTAEGKALIFSKDSTHHFMQGLSLAPLLQQLKHQKKASDARLAALNRGLKEKAGLPNGTFEHHKETAANPIPKSDVWQDFSERFKLLADEERAIVKSKREDLRMRACCNYREHPEIIAERGKPEQGPFCLIHAPECGLWMLYGGPNENFRARFDALGTRAGIELGSPHSIERLDFWLHRLYLDLRENNSRLLFAADEKGGMILDVPEASAIFCSRLEKKALETSASAVESDAQRWRPGPRTESSKMKSRRVLPAKNRRATKLDNLKIFIRYMREQHPDWTVRRIAGQIDNHYSKRTDPVPMPQSWKAAGCATLVEAYDNVRTQSRVKKFFSVVTNVTRVTFPRT
jgi:hypothetical protein